MSEEEQHTLFPTFGQSFLDHHVGKIISDTRTAIIELVANAWDAGATKVEITWPLQEGELFCVKDNGIGMTCREFQDRWMELNYNRLQSQGEAVEFPAKTTKSHRIAFGRNGIGRHAMFCFSTEYNVKTIKNNRSIYAVVRRCTGQKPFEITINQDGPTKNPSGTTISALTNSLTLSATDIGDIIGSKFIADPSFLIEVNGKRITMTDLEHLCEKTVLEISPGKNIVIRRFDTEKTGKTSKHHGIAWWVNKRLVGSTSWNCYDEPLLDARTNIAKRFTYILEADILTNEVKPDWSEFRSSSFVDDTRKKVDTHIKDDLSTLLGGLRRQRKREALEFNKTTIQNLPTMSQEKVAEFASNIQEVCPTITAKDLNATVEVLAKLEQSKSGYTLIAQLASIDSNDLDTLSILLDKWTITDAKKALDELHYRLKLIKQLESMIDNQNADELHDLQPLFERGLWIFGPEFESISFTSNRTIATVLKKMFYDEHPHLEAPNKRPDFVVLPDSTIGTYSCDDFDENHEISGLKTVFIIELKRGGYTVSDNDMDQARKYARELRRSGKLSKNTEIICYILGSKVDPQAATPSTEDSQNGPSAKFFLRGYSTLMRQAHARTFNLLKKIRSLDELPDIDEDLKEILSAPIQSEFLFKP